MKANPGAPLNTEDRFSLIHFHGFSMYPFLRPGDRLLVERDIQLPVKTGQILLFEEHQSSTNRAYTAHRVVQTIDNDQFITKGDNLFKADKRIRRNHDAAGMAVMLIRGRRIINMKNGFYRRTGKILAYLSRKNVTPGLLLARIRRVPNLIS